MMILLMMPGTANADTGPKPSVVLGFTGLEDTTYYVTLLSQTASEGPWEAPSASSDHSYNSEDQEDYEVYLKFLNYEDSDGYYFLQNFSKCVDNEPYTWGYYPPPNFKILLYFPETDTFAVSSEAYERYAFDSYFTVDATGHQINSVTAKGSYDYGNEIVSFVVRILLTLIIEIGVALLFQYRTRKYLLTIIVVNVFTQALLNVVLNLVEYQSGYQAYQIVYLLLEFFIAVIEAGIYLYAFPKYNTKVESYQGKPVLYAFTANAASFALGLLLAEAIPQMF
jgi:energy-converting hydrogenase Eha subunit E